MSCWGGFFRCFVLGSEDPKWRNVLKVPPNDKRLGFADSITKSLVVSREFRNCLFRDFRNRPRSITRLQKLCDRALFLSGQIGAQAHVLNDHRPLRVAVLLRGPEVVTARAVFRPELRAGLIG